MKKEDVIYSRKEFLNLEGQESMANIVAHIVKSDWGRKDDELNREIDVTLNIADCDRKISLALYLDDEYNRENSLNKVDTLIEVLTEFRDALEREAKYQARLEKKRAKKKAEEEAVKEDEKQ